MTACTIFITTISFAIVEKRGKLSLQISKRLYEKQIVISSEDSGSFTYVSFGNKGCNFQFIMP